MCPLLILKRLSRLTVSYGAKRHLPPNWSVVVLLSCSWCFSSRLLQVQWLRNSSSSSSFWQLMLAWFSVSPLLSGALTACECCWALVWRSELRNSQDYSRPGWWSVWVSEGKERDWQEEGWMGPCRTRSETGSHHHMRLNTTLENRETMRNAEALTLWNIHP